MCSRAILAAVALALLACPSMMGARGLQSSDILPSRTGRTLQVQLKLRGLGGQLALHVTCR